MVQVTKEISEVETTSLSLSPPPQEWAVRLLVRQQLLRQRYLAHSERGGLGPAAGNGAPPAAPWRATGSLSGLAAAVERAFGEVG